MIVAQLWVYWNPLNCTLWWVNLMLWVIWKPFFFKKVMLRETGARLTVLHLPLALPTTIDLEGCLESFTCTVLGLLYPGKRKSGERSDSSRDLHIGPGCSGFHSKALSALCSEADPLHAWMFFVGAGAAFVWKDPVGSLDHGWDLVVSLLSHWAPI